MKYPEDVYVFIRGSSIKGRVKSAVDSCRFSSIVKGRPLYRVAELHAECAPALGDGTDRGGISEHL